MTVLALAQLNLEHYTSLHARIHDSALQGSCQWNITFPLQLLCMSVVSVTQVDAIVLLSNRGSLQHKPIESNELHVVSMRECLCVQGRPRKARTGAEKQIDRHTITQFTEEKSEKTDNTAKPPGSTEEEILFQNWYVQGSSNTC